MVPFLCLLAVRRDKMERRLPTPASYPIQTTHKRQEKAAAKPPLGSRGIRSSLGHKPPGLFIAREGSTWPHLLKRCTRACTIEKLHQEVARHSICPWQISPSRSACLQVWHGSKRCICPHSTLAISMTHAVQKAKQNPGAQNQSMGDAHPFGPETLN